MPRSGAEATLRREQAFSDAVLNSLPGVFYCFDKNLRYQRWNKNLEQVTGYSGAEIARLSPLELFAGADKALVAARIQEVFAKGASEVEADLVAKDGTRGPYYFTGRTAEIDGKPHLVGVGIDITAVRRAQDALRLAHERVRSFIDSNIVGVAIASAAGTIIEANDYYLQLIGFTREELEHGKADWRAVTPPDWLPASEQAIRELHERGRCASYEMEYVRRDGLRIPVFLVEALLPGPEEHAAIFALDLTERKQAEAMLRESEEKFRCVFERSVVGMTITQRSGEVQANQAFCDLLGYSQAELRPLPWQAVTHPEDLKLNQRIVDAILSGKQDSTRFTMRFTHKRGSVVWADVSTTLRRDEAGQPLHFMTTVIDITERMQAEAHIREQAALLDHANDAIYVTALDCTILYWNRGAERTYGWTSAEALNRKTTELISPDPLAAEALAAVLLKQESWSGERSQKTKDGQKVEVFSRLTLVRNNQGQPQAFFAINTDITEKKQLEVQFLRAQRLESIGALASGIAHDLNNVLAPIIMAAPLLQEMVTDPTARHLFKTMDSSAQRGAAIVRQVLTFARGVEGERMPLNPRHLLREMEELAVETFPKGIRVESDVAADLWSVLGDATQLHQALMNLCINARDAMPGGGVLTLEGANIVLTEAAAGKILGAKPGSYACLRVIDTGTGIPPEIERKIFEPFFTTKGAGKGTGLGLSTVLGIVRSHGGFVRVASKVGQGTAFELYLPATTAEQVAPKRGSVIPWPHAHGEGILVVDDEAAVREVTRQALMEFGYQVIIAGDGAEAIRIFQKRRRDIQLVLTDMLMPEMDGATLVAALRVLDPAVRIIGITGTCEPAEIDAIESLKLPVYLTKPFSAEELLSALQKVLRV